MYKICVWTATRAEYGLLRPLLFRLKEHPETELQLVVTGTHLLDLFGRTETEIRADGFTDYVRVPIQLEDDSNKGMAVATGVMTELAAEVFEKLSPDLTVLLGDRYEMLGIATAAYLTRIPIAHLCGGDVTEGALDDAIRHCITKLSTLHFPTCEQSAKRIIQMGEDSERVFNVGEPGVENCLNMQLLSRIELEKQLEFTGIHSDYCVVTFHPATMEKENPEKQVRALIGALDSFKEMFYIITKTNADAGGRIINEILDTEGAKRSNWLVVSSLGNLKYLSLIKYARLVIGNSSSALVEVPALGVPTINIGSRQKGRMMAESVICCEPEEEAIRAAIKAGLSDEFKRKVEAGIELPFGDGRTSQLVMDALLAYLNEKPGKVLKKKLT